MAGADSFRDGLVARLRYLIELRGKSVAQVEKELGRSRGFLGDALRGGKRLPIETILDVLELLQVDPERFFAGTTSAERRWALYGPDRSAAAEVADGTAEDSLRRIREGLGDGPVEVEEVARALREVVRLLDEKGYLGAGGAGSESGSRGSGKRS